MMASIKEAGDDHPPGLKVDKQGNASLYLNSDQRRRLWGGLKIHMPELSDMIETDPEFRLALETFDGHIMLETEECRKFMREIPANECRN